MDGAGKKISSLRPGRRIGGNSFECGGRMNVEAGSKKLKASSQ
jgi:hypothetical protein